ncbi:MAG: DNA repair protein RecO [Treponema sp.]|jgi:DNA repair protein RecO (recombination protein O)|nr:DNA repair protein RecO [Treponema sp.]
MSRNESYSALILRSRPSGEANRDVWLLTAEAGLLRATVFGGPKSRLRAYAAPFHSGQAWIYHDPVKDSRKLSDFDVRSWRPGLREVYERAMTADAAAETVMASHGGGGNWAAALALTEAVLDALADAAEESCGRLLVYFWWRWTELLGFAPELEHCASCGKAVPQDSPLWYSPHENAMICAACVRDHGAHSSGLTLAGPGCRRWLEAVRPLAPVLISRYTLDSKSFSEARSLTTAILAGALGKRLASWDW